MSGQGLQYLSNLLAAEGMISFATADSCTKEVECRMVTEC